MSSAPIVVVGGGLATARFAKGYRDAGGRGPVLVLSADTSPPYHRPPLSKRYLRGEIRAEETFVEQPDWYADNGVELRLGTVVERLDDGAVVTAAGERVPYGRLVVASGAFPRRHPAPGADREGVFTLRALADSTAIRAASREARRAVIVGTGFIGLEVAASLRTLGREVTVIDRGTELFRVLDAPPISPFLKGLYEEHDVELVLGEEVAEFRGNGRVSSVVTASGLEFPADLVVIGIGVTPSVEWLEGSGVEVDDGVVVNHRFEASVDGIFAVGDVAAFHDPVFGRRRRIEHWSNANYQGAELGKLLAGGDGGYDVVSSFFSELFGQTFRVFGDTTLGEETTVEGDLGQRAVIRYLAGDRLVAALTTGQDDEANERLKEQIRADAS